MPISPPPSSYTRNSAEWLIDACQRYPTELRSNFFGSFRSREGIINDFFDFSHMFLRFKMKWTDFRSQLLLMNQINYSNEVLTMWFTRCSFTLNHSKPKKFDEFWAYPKLYVVQTLILFRAWVEYQLQSKADFNIFAFAIFQEFH